MSYKTDFTFFFMKETIKYSNLSLLIFKTVNIAHIHLYMDYLPFHPCCDRNAKDAITEYSNLIMHVSYVNNTSAATPDNTQNMLVIVNDRIVIVCTLAEKIALCFFNIQ